MDWNFVSKTWNKSWYIPIVIVGSNSSPKTKFEIFFLWNSLFFLENHGDESMGRFKMKLKKWFLKLQILCLSFLYILGDIRNKIPEFGKHLTGLGRACINQTHNLRKSMKSIWIMTKSLFGVVIYDIIPYHILTRHK